MTPPNTRTRIRTALLSQKKYKDLLSNSLKRKLEASEEWENLQIDDLYNFITQILIQTAREVLGTTSAKAKPRMTDKIRNRLTKAQELNREM